MQGLPLTISLLSQGNYRIALKITTRYLLIICMTAVFSFSTGYLIACNTIDAQGISPQTIQNAPGGLQEKDTTPFLSGIKEDDTKRNITIVFTVDEEKRIHVLQISGGYNLLTEYIKKSLEGKILESDNAVPGINYVMTVKFPSTV